MPKEHLDRVKRYKCKVNRGTRISISAVLPTFGRHRECALIKQNLIESGLFREVIIWTNTSKHNAMLYGRYLASALAAYDVIYTQDDDCVVNNLPELIKLFDGERLIYNVKLPASVRYKRTYGGAQVGLLGWGALFKKDWARVIDRYIDQFGEDMILHREADRIFTLLLNQPHSTVEARISEFPSASGTLALWRDPRHWEYFDLALKRSLRILRRT